VDSEKAIVKQAVNPTFIPLEEIGDEPVGGKARGLKVLKELGLRVPDGFVLVHPDETSLDLHLLQTHLDALGPGPKAVRSSGISEDGSIASFAGQFESYLNLSGTGEIADAIVRCIRAARHQRVTHYAGNRADNADLRISVIVQNMVMASCSGVIFTADPVSNRRDKLIINAVEGLGEELVSGRKDAHHYEVFRSGSDLERAENSNGDLLSSHHLRELTEKAKLAEAQFGHPVDMEWAIDGSGKVFWLQTRPITTLSGIHFNELDTVSGPSSEVWTLGNIGEMMPGATTPLTYSVVVDAIDYGMCVLADKGGAFRLKNRQGYHYIQMFYNRLFINLSHMMDYASRIWLNKSENIQLALSVQVNHAIRESWKAPFPQRLFNFLRQSAAVIRAGSYLKKLHGLADTFRVNTDLSPAELYRELGLRRADVCIGFGHHLITSGQSGTLYSAFMGIMTDDKRLPDASDHHIATILLSGIPDIESANAVKSLESFSDLIRGYEEFSDRFVQSDPEEGLRLIREEAPPEISQLYQEFILRHGHRCVRESELRESPWEENQPHLIRLLQTKVRLGPVEHRSVDVGEEIRNTLKKLPLHKRIIFRILLPTARKAVARREISKALAIKMVNELRKGYRALAIKMLDDTDQIYFLTHEEIGRLIEKDDRSLIDKANRRRELLPETDRLRFPEVCFGIPEPLEEEGNPEVREGQLQGIPVSSGKTTAPVRIVHTLEDAGRLQKGEIMVASFTDIGWTPYFSIISGLVTEIGSPLSHGAVVAREYGIPAVVGVKGAKTWLRDGETILLDGDLGVVTKYEGNKVSTCRPRS